MSETSQFGFNSSNSGVALGAASAAVRPSSAQPPSRNRRRRQLLFARTPLIAAVASVTPPLSLPHHETGGVPRVRHGRRRCQRRGWPTPPRQQRRCRVPDRRRRVAARHAA
uniref:Hypothetical conserved protein 1596 n=1 Tax=Amblyomma variegatum TaxID=34610 RepID=F0JAC0_AMBVA|nr:TPA_inf: hypothetical conserved protein 1596 [Amblyomma variegatum]